jgi:biotin synthase
LYCGLCKQNDKAKRFRMSEDQIVQTALSIAEAGLGTVVLQSGEDYHYTRDMLCSIIRRILDKADVAITLSLGERPEADMRAFKAAGASRYLMKHETMNPELYAVMRPGLRLEDRLRCINLLRELGYQVGVGTLSACRPDPGDLALDIEFFSLPSRHGPTSPVHSPTDTQLATTPLRRGTDAPGLRPGADCDPNTHLAVATTWPP